MSVVALKGLSLSRFRWDGTGIFEKEAAAAAAAETERGQASQTMRDG